MNSKWEINKIGLVDFWYYDEQEFTFLDGRMLLRGSNGSGKSVTMQSVVPLLLDGNMRPERLDPFGSRDRKMSNYLLEENDEREERTGYLYMELKRIGSHNYLTIGIGMRARKGKPLESWYFSIADGRRIGHDFFLYKEMDGKITLSRQELTNRLAEGGRVMNQAEYQDYVNKQIFGFETLEEYKEMIDLLIQLRTPKLSKDFKPSVINEILSNSLQPLTEDDLRPMSEAIENMDNLSTNLVNRKASKGAADKIFRAYNQYNSCILYEKGMKLRECRQQFEKLTRDADTKRKEIDRQENEIHQLERQLEDLEIERKTMEKERESLNSSNVISLKRQEEEIQERICGRKRIILEKEEQLRIKQDRWNDGKMAVKKKEDAAFQSKARLEAGLGEMESYAEEASFEEFTFVREELTENFDREFSFDTHISMVNQLLENLQEGLEQLRRAQLERERLEDAQKQLDTGRRTRDQAEHRRNEYEMQFVQIQGELKERIYAWNGKNEELILPKEAMREISRLIDGYGETCDFQPVIRMAGEEQYKKKEALFLQKNQVIRKRELEAEVLAEKQREYEDWKGRKEAEPECSPMVKKNRERLDKEKIPYLRFYQMLDFGEGINQKEKNLLEEALSEMGLLDALVIEEEYREQVLAQDTGLCDKYIFTGTEHVRDNILECLNICDEMDDIFINQRINHILSSIGCNKSSISYISREGIYGMGILTGTVSGEYESKYIGRKARIRHREEKLQKLEREMEDQEQVVGQIDYQIHKIEERIHRLDEEYARMPKEEDLRLASTEYEEAGLVLARAEDEVLRLEAVLLKLQETFREVMLRANAIAQKLYLSCHMEVFEQAEAAMRHYQNMVYEIKVEHTRYLQIRSDIRSTQENLLDCESDMDTIRYDMGQQSMQLRSDEMNLESIQKQLGLTNYEEMKDRLDYCIHRLEQIPGEIKQNITQSEHLRSICRVGCLEVEQSNERLKILEERLFVLKGNFEEEYRLGHVELSELVGKVDRGGTEELTEEMLEQVLNAVAGYKPEKSKEDLISKLNESYFENRSLLLDYNLTMDYLFSERLVEKYSDIQPKRVELSGKYRGKNVKFRELVTILAEEIEDLENLIKTGDKELFEDILANTISRKIRGKINASMTWVEKMNQLMNSMNTSSGLKLSLRWRSKTAEVETQLDTKELVELLRKDSRFMTEEEFEKLSMHFRSKVEQARRNMKEQNGTMSFYVIMKETLDYRRWFEFQLFSQKSGENKKELTNSVFGTLSGGEKAMAMYVPLFSAVVAKYQGARKDAPRIISLDEAFAGVDNRNIRDMFRLMVEFEFNFIINSQILWGDCDTLKSLAIYQLIRPENVKFVTVISYLWNGRIKQLVEEVKVDD